MKLYHAYIAGKSKLDRIDFFLVEQRPREELREILIHFGLGNIRQMLRSGQVTHKEAEAMCIIASKLLKLPEVEALREYVKKAMGISESKFFYHEIPAPMDKNLLQDETLQLALQEYHQDGLFLALWANAYYPIPVKIGGFVLKEAQFLLRKTAAQNDKRFTEFVHNAETVEDLLGLGED